MATIFEPFRIQSVEPIAINTRAERERVLAERRMPPTAPSRWQRFKLGAMRRAFGHRFEKRLATHEQASAAA